MVTNRADADATARTHLEMALARYERLGARADVTLARHDLATLPYTRRLLDAGLVITARQWARIEAMLPRSERLGRPRADDQRTCSAILYVLHSGCGWANLPPEFGDGATAHRRFQQMRKGGIWDGIAAILNA
jgi:hypothetical protein